MNMKNFGTLTGRATREPKFFENADGSKKVALTIAVDSDFKKNGKTVTDFIKLEGFIPAKKSAKVYDYVKKGTLMQIGYTVKSSVYEKDGETVYTQNLSIEKIALLGGAHKNNTQEETEFVPFDEDFELPF